MPTWLINIAKALLNKKKIMAWIAAIIIAIMVALFGVTAEEIKEAVKDAPFLTLPPLPVTTTLPTPGK